MRSLASLFKEVTVFKACLDELSHLFYMGFRHYSTTIVRLSFLASSNSRCFRTRRLRRPSIQPVEGATKGGHGLTTLADCVNSSPLSELQTHNRIYTAPPSRPFLENCLKSGFSRKSRHGLKWVKSGFRPTFHPVLHPKTHFWTHFSPLTKPIQKDSQGVGVG